MDSPLHLRIFVSSPSDVAAERAAVLSVLQRLPREPLLKGRIALDMVAYDDKDAPVPLAATRDPQSSVNLIAGEPSDCDLTVVMLWSRIGTPIPPDKRRPDGSAYESGTVWELEDAESAGREVWVYQRTEPPKVGLDDPAFDAKRAQYDAVKRFVAGFKNADGSARRGRNTYATAADFEPLFKKHVESWLRHRLEAARPPQEAATISASGSELLITPLLGPRRVRPLDGHPVLQPDAAEGPVFTGGVRVSFTLSHNGVGPHTIHLHGIVARLLRYQSPAEAGLAYAVNGEEVLGAGVAQPHVFTLALDGSRVGPASWLLDEGRRAVARGENLLDTEPPRVLTFAAAGAESEEIQGSVLAVTPGLYELAFEFHYSVGGADHLQLSRAVRIYGDE